MIDSEILEILRCPDTMQSLAIADDDLVKRANQMIEDGSCNSAVGNSVTRKIEGGLIRADGLVLYPIRDRIPMMIVTEGLVLPGEASWLA
jgi:uncharacterized protein YbaR (Trm112 family)